MSRTDTARIHEALQLLNSVAADERDHLRKAMSNGYGSLKEFVSDLGENAENRISGYYSAGKAKVKDVAYDIDENVHDNAWKYIGGAAVAALIVGFLLGRSRR